MVVTVDTCTGPQLYVGPAFAYHEQLVDGVRRMTDSEWKSELDASVPAEVPWMLPTLAD